MSASTREWLLSRLLKLHTAFDALKAENKVLAEQCESTEADLRAAEGRLATLSDQSAELAELAELRKKVADMAPQKVFEVRQYKGEALDILSVAHLCGKTIITVDKYVERTDG